MAGGRLAKKPDETSKRLLEDSYARFKYDATSEQDGAVIVRVEELAEKHGVSMTEISLAWLLEKVTAPIVGATKVSHIEGAANCFGDYYTRNGLDLKQRELITFCFLMAQGGCEPQLTAHAKGNMNLGNDKDFLIKVVSQCLPYIGYPRSLNAVGCVNKAAES